MSNTNGFGPTTWPANKIMLIKEVREKIGCDLKTAKDAVEAANGNIDEAFKIARRTLERTSGVSEMVLEELIASVIAHSGCSRKVAQASLAQTGYKLKSATQLARALIFENELTFGIFGRMIGHCQVCKQHGKLANVIMSHPKASGSIGPACWKCIERLHSNLDLIEVFGIFKLFTV
ncbi:MAG: ribosomal protein L7/L12 [Gemmataceae bacterium]